MCDFDLRQALPCSPEFDEQITESRCFDMKEVQDEIFRLEDGLELMVSHNRWTMRRVGNLVLLVNKMMTSLSHCGRELNNNELCSAIMDQVVEETIVETVINASTGASKFIFHRSNSVKECTLSDTLQKNVVRPFGGLKLQAITLKGGNCQHKVNFKMSRYVTAHVSPGDGLTVVLSVANNLHISCCMADDKATLTLEECGEADLQRISDNGNMDRFLFFKRTTGVSLTTFESVKHRGWFISTSSEDDNQPVEMCRVDAACRLTSFRVN